MSEAGSCVFQPQHYRPAVCKVCFMNVKMHTQIQQAASDKTEPTAKYITRSQPTQKLEATVVVTAPTAATEIPAAIRVESNLSASSSSISSVGSRNSMSRNLSSPESVGSSNHNKLFDASASGSSDSAEDWVSEEDEQEEEDEVGEVQSSSSHAPAPPPVPFPSSAFYANPRSASFSVTSTGTSRADLLRSITSQPRLRRRSEYAPLKPKPIVLDLNSELTFAMRKKGLDASRKVKDEIGQQLDDDRKDALTKLSHRLNVLGPNAAHPTDIESLEAFLMDHTNFVKSLGLPSGSSSSSSARTGSVPTIHLEDIDSTFPAAKLEVCLRYRDALEKLAMCVRAAKKYTEGEFAEWKKIVRSSSSTSQPNKHADWMFVDSQILAKSMNALIEAMEAIRKLSTQANQEGFLFVTIDPAFAQASQAASDLIDLLFEKCRVAYETTFEKTIGSPTNATAAAATLTLSGSNQVAPSLRTLTPHYSQTSKAIKSYQTLNTSMTLFRQLHRSMGAPPLVHFSLAQRGQAEEFEKLQKAIESSPEYKESIAVSQRKGQWDVKQEVKLRSTSLSFTPSASIQSDSKQSIVSPAHGRRASTTTGSQSSSWLQPLKELREQHANLFLLLEKPAAAVARSLSPKRELTQPTSLDSLDDAESPVCQVLELKTLLLPLFTLPLPLLTQFILRHIIPLHHTDAFKLLVQHALSVDQDHDEESHLALTQIFFECVTKGFISGVKMCIGRDGALPSLGINVNTRLPGQGNGGNTALHLASAASNAEMMVLLLRHGANPLSINAFERNALFALRSLFASGRDSKVTTNFTASTAHSDPPLMNHVASYVAKYFNSPKLADCKLKIQDQSGQVTEFFGHRIVLCSQSEVFRVMLEEDSTIGKHTTPKESGGPQWISSLEDSVDSVDNGPPTVLLPDVPNVESFGLFMRYLYTGTILFTNDDLHIASGVLQLATRFMVEPLREVSSSHIGKRIVSQNVESIYNLASCTGSRALQHEAEEFVIVNYEQHHREWMTTHNDTSSDDSHPHALLIRLLADMNIDGLKQAQSQRAPKWRM